MRYTLLFFVVETFLVFIKVHSDFVYIIKVFICEVDFFCKFYMCLKYTMLMNLGEFIVTFLGYALVGPPVSLILVANLPILT